MGFITEFIKRACAKSQILAHHVIWNIETNKFRDEEGQVKDGEGNTNIASSETWPSFSIDICYLDTISGLFPP